MQEGGGTNAEWRRCLLINGNGSDGSLSEEADLVIKRFIDEFGIEAFQSLRSQVLEALSRISERGLIGVKAAAWMT